MELLGCWSARSVVCVVATRFQGAVNSFWDSEVLVLSACFWVFVVGLS